MAVTRADSARLGWTLHVERLVWAARCYEAGLKHAIERGWIVLHESGTFIRFTQAGADLFA